MAEAIKGFDNDGTFVTAITADTELITGGGFVGEVQVAKVGSADFVITLYDNVAASGTKIFAITNPAVGNIPIRCRVGLGLTLVTTGSTSGEFLITYRSFK